MEQRYLIFKITRVEFVKSIFIISLNCVALDLIIARLEAIASQIMDSLGDLQIDQDLDDLEHRSLGLPLGAYIVLLLEDLALVRVGFGNVAPELLMHRELSVTYIAFKSLWEANLLEVTPLLPARHRRTGSDGLGASLGSIGSRSLFVDDGGACVHLYNIALFFSKITAAALCLN